MNPCLCPISPSGAQRGQKNKEGFILSSVPHRLKWLRELSNVAAWLWKANLSAFCFPSQPWVSVPKITLITQSLWNQLCLWPALFLLWHTQTMVLLLFKLTFLPSGAHCTAGTLATIRHTSVLRMLWWVSPGSLCCRAKGLRDISWWWSSSGDAAPQNTWSHSGPWGILF